MLPSLDLHHVYYGGQRCTRGVFQSQPWQNTCMTGAKCVTNLTFFLLKEGSDVYPLSFRMIKNLNLELVNCHIEWPKKSEEKGDKGQLFMTRKILKEPSSSRQRGSKALREVNGWQLYFENGLAKQILRKTVCPSIIYVSED